MTANEIVNAAQADGLTLFFADGRLRWAGPQAAADRWLLALREHKAAIILQLANDRTDDPTEAECVEINRILAALPAGPDQAEGERLYSLAIEAELAGDDTTAVRARVDLARFVAKLRQKRRYRPSENGQT